MICNVALATLKGGGVTGFTFVSRFPDLYNNNGFTLQLKFHILVLTEMCLEIHIFLRF